MSESEREARAGEYVLGTMPADERAAFDRELQHDEALLAMVRAWEERLADLLALVPEQTPDPQVWAALERMLERMTERDLGSAPSRDLGSAPSRDLGSAPSRDLGSAPSEVTETVTAMAGSLSLLRRSRARWRAAAAAMTALAACLAIFVASGLWSGRGASYFAVVNRGGELPALVVEVDTGAQVVHVRSLAAEIPADRSLELWYIAPSGGAPSSLGVVDQPRRDRVLPVAARRGELAGATLAVSVEAKGGSRTGGPTGPVIYSGKLLQP